MKKKETQVKDQCLTLDLDLSCGKCQKYGKFVLKIIYFLILDGFKFFCIFKNKIA